MHDMENLFMEGHVWKCFVLTPEQVGHMEAVLASAAYLEQGIAWGEFCLSNLYLKHALCVETKNCLSAEAVSYKNGIFH